MRDPPACAGGFYICCGANLCLDSRTGISFVKICKLEREANLQMLL